MADWTQNLVTIEVPKEAAETVEITDASVLSYSITSQPDAVLLSSRLVRERTDAGTAPTNLVSLFDDRQVLLRWDTPMTLPSTDVETIDTANYTLDIEAGTLALDSSLLAAGDVFKLLYAFRFYLRLWTGLGSITAGGNTYQGGGKALGVSEYENTTGDPDRRLQIRLSGIPADMRAQFLQDSGPLPVTVGWIYSQDRGGTWAEVPIKFRGRLSSPSLVAGQLTVEVETQRGDVDQGIPLRWSHEDQQRRFPGDKGLEYMRALSQQGVESSWPP